MGALYECPSCGSPATKAMYSGLPMRLCGDLDRCAYCWGPCAWLFELGLPFNGVFIRYDNYWSCLWEFLTGVSAEKANHE